MSNYKTLKNTWVESCVKSGVEGFFISYAVEGAITDSSRGVRAGLPIDYPIVNSPVKEPSPLNTRWIYNKPDVSISGIL